MADTGIKKRFGVAHVSYEPLSGYVILSVAGQILRLEKREFEDMEQAVNWATQERDRRDAWRNNQ